MHEDSIWKVMRIHSGWKFCENRQGKQGWLLDRDGLGLGFKGLGFRVLGSRFRV